MFGKETEMTTHDANGFEREPYNLENIPDEVIERVTRIVLEEVARQLVVTGKVDR